MSALPIDCEAVLQRLDAFRRDELTVEETRELQRHLEACRHCLCNERYEQAFLDRLRAAGITCTCPDTLRARIHERLERERPNG
jgi:anti-sigma factor (TIGR02949 family)